MLARGEPMGWLTGAGLVVGLLMVVSLVAFVFLRGAVTFWPATVLRAELTSGIVAQGEVTRTESFTPDASFLSALNAADRDRAEQEIKHGHGELKRRLVRIGNFEITGEHFMWVEDFRIAPGGEKYPEWLVVLERMSWGRFYGTPVAYLANGEVVADGPAAAWAAFEAGDRGEHAAEGLVLRLVTSGGQLSDIEVSEIVRGYRGNDLDWADKLSLYVSRWHEYLTAEPREANSEGGVFPAIFGTIVMTLGMTILVVPFGVMAALYLREYARQGWLTSVVRISINNLAGVPSIVFGVFGMGFFSYLVGGSIDAIFFADKLPNPTFGTGGIMWASLTLALLTLPVVIVATEEALAAVPSSMREGSFACGATKWQTIQRVVLPRALPGIMTGAILAMARGAGEVAPLMLVGAVKLAPELPLDMTFPFFHPERSFMHLGFHIYDLGFQSQNSEAAKPMVFTTTMLLMGIVLFLNAAAIWLRSRLTRKFSGSKF